MPYTAVASVGKQSSSAKFMLTGMIGTIKNPATQNVKQIYNFVPYSKITMPKNIARVTMTPQTISINLNLWYF